MEIDLTLLFGLAAAFASGFPPIHWMRARREGLSIALIVIIGLLSLAIFVAWDLRFKPHVDINPSIPAEAVGGF